MSTLRSSRAAWGHSNAELEFKSRKLPLADAIGGTSDCDIGKTSSPLVHWLYIELWALGGLKGRTSAGPSGVWIRHIN